MEPEPKQLDENRSVHDTRPIDNFGSTVKPKSVETPHNNEDLKSNETEKPMPKNGNSKLLKILLVILLVLVLASSAAGAAYWWRDKTAIEQEKTNTDDIAKLEKQVASLTKKLAAAEASTAIEPADGTECTAVAPSATVIENIKASITSGNTAALSGYMAPSVNVIIAATEGVGPSKPAIAVSTVSTFITNVTTSWDYNFSLPAATLSGYTSGGYKDYFPNIAVVGKASNGKVIAFSFDCDGKINTIFMAISAELL
jgi:hypothetical protein